MSDALRFMTTGDVDMTDLEGRVLLSDMDDGGSRCVGLGTIVKLKRESRKRCESSM